MDMHTQKIYDSQAELYKSQTQNFKFPQGIFEYFLQALSGKKILDIGCGYWREIEYLRKKWYDAYGIDFSKWLLSLADKKIQAYLTHWDMKHLGLYFDTTSFDGLISSASIVHMSHDDGIAVLQSSYSLLKTWWILFLSIKVDRERKIIQKESISTPWTQKTYVYYWKQEIETILEKIWFSLLKSHTWTPWKDSWKILICKK